MNWSNLKNGLCANCGEKLHMGLLDTISRCSRCTFVIGREKWEKITRPRAYYKGQEIDNLSELNNLGHDLVSEDFSDSPFRK